MTTFTAHTAMINGRRAFNWVPWHHSVEQTECTVTVTRPGWAVVHCPPGPPEIAPGLNAIGFSLGAAIEQGVATATW